MQEPITQERRQAISRYLKMVATDLENPDLDVKLGQFTVKGNLTENKFLTNYTMDITLVRDALT